MGKNTTVVRLCATRLMVLIIRYTNFDEIPIWVEIGFHGHMILTGAIMTLSENMICQYAILIFQKNTQGQDIHGVYTKISLAISLMALADADIPPAAYTHNTIAGEN